MAKVALESPAVHGRKINTCIQNGCLFFFSLFGAGVACFGTDTGTQQVTRRVLFLFPRLPCFCEISLLSGPEEARACHWLQQQQRKRGRVRDDWIRPSGMGFHWKRRCHMCVCLCEISILHIEHGMPAAKRFHSSHIGISWENVTDINVYSCEISAFHMGSLCLVGNGISWKKSRIGMYTLKLVHYMVPSDT